MTHYRMRRVARRVFSTFIWAASALFLGALIGLAAVVLPPTGAFGIVGVATLVLLFLAPADDRLVPSLPLNRRFLLVSTVTSMCVPGYYAFSLPGLPWISFHRLTLFPVVLMTAVTLAVSSEARQHVQEVCRKSYILAGMAACYALAALISIFFSQSPGSSASRFTSLVLEWYLPCIAVLLLMRKESQIDQFVKVICYSAMFVALIGIIDFYRQKNTAFNLMPSWMYNALAESNPNMAMLLLGPALRNGMYRASSVYGSALSFGEFSGLMLPFGYHFLVYGRRFSEKLFGVILALFMLLGIVASGSRGGYLMLFSGSAVFFILWFVREVRTAPRSLAPAIAIASFTPFAFATVIAVLFWRKLHNIVIGGGMEQYSTDSRTQEWYAALPHIMHNPIIGNGFGIGADVVGFRYPGASVPTLDSSLISIFVETGIIGLLSFFGIVIAAIILSMVTFISERSRASALFGATAASLTGFLVYRTVLSQMDNHFMFFLIIALVGVMIKEFKGKDMQSRASDLQAANKFGTERDART